MASKVKQVIITMYGEPSEEALNRLAKIMKKIYINEQLKNEQQKNEGGE